MTATPKSPGDGGSGHGEHRIAADYLAWAAKHYDRARGRNRWAHTASGLLIVALGVGIPFLVNASWSWKDTALTAAALILSALSGLGAFFQWEKKWRLQAGVVVKLRGLEAEWRLALARAAAGPDVDGVQSAKVAAEADVALVRQVRALVEQETQAFFALVDRGTGETSKVVHAAQTDANMQTRHHKGKPEAD